MKTSIVVLAALLVATPAFAQDLEDARVVLARGDVTVRGASASQGAIPGMIVHQGDQVRTGHDGMVRLLLGGAAVIDLSPDTSMVIQRAQTSGGTQTRLKMWSGRLWARVSKLFGNDSKFEVESPNAVAGVRGTEFVFDVAPNGETQITVFDGSVAVNSRDGGQEVLLEIGGRLTANDAHSLVPSTVSDAERHLLRSSSSAGSHLGANEAQLRLQHVADHIPHTLGGGATQQPILHDNTRVQIPPIDLDPAQGKARIHGTIQIQN